MQFLAIGLAGLGIIGVAAIVLVGVSAVGASAVAKYVALLPSYYLRALYSTVGQDLSDQEEDMGEVGLDALNLKKHVDDSVALPSYYSEPIFDDIRDAAASASARMLATLADGKSQAQRWFTSDVPLIGLVTWLGIWLGLLAGGVVGVVLSVLILAIHLLATAVLTLAADVAGAVMRGFDLVSLVVRNVSMVCPSCSENVRPRPVYVCRCGRLHRDIRPGRYGVRRRICRCGLRLPTSLGACALRLEAMCPVCRLALPPKFGVTTEILFPFLGQVNAGKTQLMYAVVSALIEIVEQHGGVIEPVGDTEDRLKLIKDDLALRGSPSKTIRNVPRAYMFRLVIGASERLLYLFDAAGELYNDSDRIEDLRYLDKARTFVFVLNPMSSDRIWAQLTPAQQADFRSQRSEDSENATYDHVLEQMKRLNVRRKNCRLAIVVSKRDLVSQISFAGGAGMPSARELVWGDDLLGMGNAARDADESFGRVDYFLTSATSADENFDNGIAELVRWLMRSENVRLDERW